MAFFNAVHGAVVFVSVLYSYISAASQEVSVNGVIMAHGCLSALPISAFVYLQTLTPLMATAVHKASAVSLAVATQL